MSEFTEDNNYIAFHTTYPSDCELTVNKKAVIVLYNDEEIAFLTDKNKLKFKVSGSGRIKICW